MSEDKPQGAQQHAAGHWQYKNDDAKVDPILAAPSGKTAVQWTASEFIAHNKGFGWYAVLALSVLLFTTLVYLLTHDITSVGIIVFVGILFGIAAARKPRELTYQLDDKGLTIGAKKYAYSSFKSFSVVQEGAFSSIVFWPLQRFMPPITIYYEMKDEDDIASVLAQHLPMEDRGHDMIDRLVKRIRF